MNIDRFTMHRQYACLVEMNCQFLWQYSSFHAFIPVQWCNGHYAGGALCRILLDLLCFMSRRPLVHAQGVHTLGNWVFLVSAVLLATICYFMCSNMEVYTRYVPICKYILSMFLHRKMQRNISTWDNALGIFLHGSTHNVGMFLHIWK
jgi:hypothetical protein